MLITHIPPSLDLNCEITGLANTAKSAEIVAINFGIKRFNETKDKNDNRDIIRINENNSAFYGGKWVKDSLLPDDLMS